MRVFVFSDTHGMWKNIITVLQRDTPDLIIHLGDHTADANAVREQTTVPVLNVSGNSITDRAANIPDHRTVTLDGHTVYLCHGHLHRVKETLLYLTYAARENHATLALFGHTHLPCDEQFDGVRLINPGSARSTYAILTVTQDSVTCEHRSVL